MMFWWISTLPSRAIFRWPTCSAAIALTLRCIEIPLFSLQQSSSSKRRSLQRTPLLGLLMAFYLRPNTAGLFVTLMKEVHLSVPHAPGECMAR